MTAPLISDRLRRQEVAPRAERAIPDWKNWVRKECTDCDGTEWCDSCMGLRFTFRPPGLTAAEREELTIRVAAICLLFVAMGIFFALAHHFNFWGW